MPTARRKPTATVGVEAPTGAATSSKARVQSALVLGEALEGLAPPILTAARAPSVAGIRMWRSPRRQGEQPRQPSQLTCCSPYPASARAVVEYRSSI